VSSTQAAYDESLARMTAAVQALPARRRDEVFGLVAAHLDTVTAEIGQHRRRRPQQGVVSSCRPVATHTPEGGTSP
jgi:hypothetical protein